MTPAAPPSETERLGADPLARSLGAELLSVTPGRARTAVTVRAEHCNALGWPHGGLIFTLADFAFAAACNAGRPPTVAVQVGLTFLAPARLGERLEAEAEHRGSQGRSHLYRLSVYGADRRLIAEGYGLARTLKEMTA